MAIFNARQQVEFGAHIVRARKTAAMSRVAVGVLGILLVLHQPALVEHPALGVVGFVTILISGGVQLAAPRLALLSVEEALSASAGVLIVGFGNQHVDVVSLLWLVAVASGVLARGGRVHSVGPAVLLIGLLLPLARDGRLEAAYGGFVIGTVALLLTAGRLTSELNALLRQARMQADSAETLLLAGDIAARMSDRVGPAQREADASVVSLTDDERAAARIALARLIGGEGLTMVVQPIVDIVTGEVHAFEALARFGEGRADATPLHWFALATQLGGRPALERACLHQALELLPRRPAGTSLSVNLSAPVLCEPLTLQMLDAAAARHPQRLRGLIVEITEETLVEGDQQLRGAIGPLIADGAVLAVDDMGAGYSGMRQITAVRPAYLKIDRSLAAGIDTDPERSALVAALAGYARQVGAHLVVEGVETTAELRVLRRIGVRLVQGYRLGRPGEPWPEVDAQDARGGAGEPSGAPLAGSSGWPAADRAALERASHRRATTRV
jgi:EAL domain-containing protein (putative c-di-GMP-specific phosphodiesterase class I)